MKKLILLALILLPFLSSCSKSLTVNVQNSLDMDRDNEMVEIDLNDIQTSLALSEGDQFIVTNANKEEIPYQITHDKKVIFQASVKKMGNTTFNIHKGTPQTFEVKACGKLYPERLDDLAWENDLMGFRAYGPALQKRGDRAFGYDLFAKRGTSQPVLEDMYAKETDEAAWAKFRALRKEDPEAAKKMLKEITYHSDRGHGMDCYAVGPTLGAGVAALLNGEEIVYPWCYKTCEILDNGPLRFTARLIFNPTEYKGKEITESRVITLDAGSHMNRTSITYQNLNEESPIVTGIVLHNMSEAIAKDTNKGYITYQDPTTGPDQGQLFLGHTFPKGIKDTRITYFSEEEMKTRNNAKGHVLAESTYVPNSEFVYYWGFGWDRSDIKDFTTWNTYVEAFSEKIKSPLTVTLN